MRKVPSISGYDPLIMGNQKPSIEEEQTISRPKGKGQRSKQWSTELYTEN
jgi:hypothetical protein